MVCAESGRICGKGTDYFHHFDDPDSGAPRRPSGSRPAFLNVPMWRAIPICIIGNLIPVPFILLFITKIFTWLKGTKHLKPFVEKMENRAMNKKEQIEKYEFWGLLLFVGIPLPGTGAWTGSLIAALLGIKFKKAFPAVCLGILLASFIMTVLSYTVIGGIFA